MGKTNIKKFIEHQRVLDKIIRFSNRPRIKNQNISEHSFHTAFYSMILADMEESFGNRVDKERLLKAALLHDLEESMTGDIIHTFKYRSEKIRDEIKRLSSELLEELLGNLPEKMAKEYMEIWNSAKDMSTIEGKIIEAADKLEGMIYSMEEHSLGNKIFAETVDVYVKEIKKIGLKSADILVEQLLSK